MFSMLCTGKEFNPSFNNRLIHTKRYNDYIIIDVYIHTHTVVRYAICLLTIYTMFIMLFNRKVFNNFKHRLIRTHTHIQKMV